MGDGGWGIGPNPQSPIPNPQSPIPKFFNINNKKNFNIIYLKINLLKKIILIIILFINFIIKMTDIKLIRINCSIKITNKENVQNFIDTSKELISKTLANDEGVQDYDLYQSQTDSNKYLFFETWNQNKINDHINKDHLKKAVSEFKKVCEMKIENFNIEKETPKEYKSIRMNCTFETKEEKEEEAIKETLELVKNSLKDEGVIDYDLFKSCTRNHQFLIFETWKNQDCLTKHMNSEHFKKLVPKIQEKGTLKIEQLYLI